MKIILALHISNTDGKTLNYLEGKHNRQKCIHFSHGDQRVINV